VRRLHRAGGADRQQTDTAAGDGKGPRQAKETGEKSAKAAKKKAKQE
jgi:hypothetical protein